MSDLYRLEWESVHAIGKGAVFYHGDEPRCVPKDVPEEYWSKVYRETDNPWDQYNTLKGWAEAGTQLVRNVKLYKAANKIEWLPYAP